MHKKSGENFTFWPRFLVSYQSVQQNLPNTENLPVSESDLFPKAIKLMKASGRQMHIDDTMKEKDKGHLPHRLLNSQITVGTVWFQRCNMAAATGDKGALPPYSEYC